MFIRMCGAAQVGNECEPNDCQATASRNIKQSQIGKKTSERGEHRGRQENKNRPSDDESSIEIQHTQ